MSKRVSELQSEMNNLATFMSTLKFDAYETDVPNIEQEPIMQNVWVQDYNGDVSEEIGHFEQKQVGTKYKYKGHSSDSREYCKIIRNKDIKMNRDTWNNKADGIDSQKSKFEKLKADCQDSKENLDRDIKKIDYNIRNFNSAKQEVQGIIGEYNSIKGQIYNIFNKNPNGLLDYSDNASSSCLNVNCDQLTSSRDALQEYREQANSIISEIESCIQQLSTAAMRCRKKAREWSERLE